MVQVLLGVTRGRVPVRGRWRFNAISTTYLVLLDVVGSGCGELSCRM